EFARGVVLCDPYSQTFSAARMTPDERLSALMPYRSFDASRLKLSGSANWDLEDALYLAFREPESLETFDVLDPGPQDAPLSAAERPAELLKVARLWDARSLLRLSSVGPRRPYKGVRLFNAPKNSSTDRQIADRRGRNWVEGKIRGSSDSSRFLPTGPSLTNLFLNPASHRFSINVMDRNDFYHQISASPQRSLKNLLMPPLPVDWLCGTQALREFQAARKGGSCEATELYLYFGAFIQGDALGVEFATSAHSACAKEGGLLEGLSWAPPPAGRATGFEKVSPSESVMYHLPRAVAHELVVLSALCHVVTCDVAAPLRFHFLQIGAKQSKLVTLLRACGWTVGPLLDPSESPEYDWGLPRLVEWVFYLVEVDAILVGPPSDAFSPQSLPAVGSPAEGAQVLAEDRRNGWCILSHALALGALGDWNLGVVEEGPYGRLLHPALDAQLCASFDCAIRARLQLASACDLRTEGLESALVNELAIGLPWKTRRAWKWPRRIAAVQVAYGLYTHLPCCPTRLMPAEHPSRDAEIPDIDTVNAVLARYGQASYSAGRPYAHFSETINSFSAGVPKAGRQLQPAWDVALAWRKVEPTEHRTAMPWQVLIALVALSLSWGWPLVAGTLALAFGGMLRIGEVLGACRKSLVLPRDVGGTVDFALFSIEEPKTRFRSARHQSVKIDQPDLLKVIELSFGELCSTSRLWPYSGQSLRTRFRQLCRAFDIQAAPGNNRPFLELVFSGLAEQPGSCSSPRMPRFCVVGAGGSHPESWRFTCRRLPLYGFYQLSLNEPSSAYTRLCNAFMTSSMRLPS
ncbi:unnamed protein product, partial [Symbiodinium sp. CCMP2456]